MGKALISSPRGTDGFITLKGIDPALEPNVTDIKKAMQKGSVEALSSAAGTSFPGILIGRQLAEALAVEVGDSVDLLTDQGTLSPGGMVPRNRTARVAGIFIARPAGVRRRMGLRVARLCRAAGRCRSGSR